MRRCRAVFVSDEAQRYQCAENEDEAHSEHWAVVYGWNRPVAILRWARRVRKVKGKEVRRVAPKGKPKKKPGPYKTPRNPYG